MTEFKVGDKVEVALTATGKVAYIGDDDEYVDVRLFIPPRLVTKIVEPSRLLDKVTAENIKALPINTAVVAAGGLPAFKLDDNKWATAVDGKEDPVTDSCVLRWFATIIFLP